MANVSEDIQCAGSDTRPPMLDRTDFALWQQRIRLYCRGKENDVNILKSIDEGPFQLGTFRETLAEGTKGALHLGPERPRVYYDLSPEDKERTKEKPFMTTMSGFSKLINDMRNIKMTMSIMQLNSKFMNNMLPEWGRFVTAVKLNRGLRDSNYDHLIEDRRTMHGVQPHSQGTALNPNDHITPENTSKTRLADASSENEDLALNVDNVFQADDYLVYDEAGPSYDSDILSEIHDHDHYQDAICEHHEEHKMHDDVQPNYVSDSHANYMSDSNMILYDHYVKDNTVPVVQIVDNSLTAELATYKEQVELYERRARKEINTLTNYLDMKALKEKVEDKLYKQDQSLQIVHVLCKPKPYYNEHNKVAIGYKNPLCLTRSKQVQPALYNGYEIIKNNHVSALVHNTNDTLEIAEITRRKMKDPECVTNKVKITPPDYSKENYLATFTPQKQLTPEQIFWSQDLIKMK
ncbi:hypothetical protein Tco_0772072 [Tanacetum coccineum]|uniref:Integrase, catalytic region, zinc finger, CCHC-type, peptidase aspartic, catalytic n=1 Tax=Tanacetum coccineum TaxID=301880 RepID=A0ABQ4ZI83_9ASTR